MKLFSFLTALTTVFYAFHLVMDFYFSDRFEAAIWVKELHFNIALFFPVFLLLTSTIGERRNLNIVAWSAGILFATCTLLNIGNRYELYDIYHLQYPTGLALLTLLAVAIVHFVKKQKHVSDLLKLLWLFCLVYAFVVPNVVTKYHQAGWFIIAMQFLYPIMMAAGLLKYYQKPKT